MSGSAAIRRRQFTSSGAALLVAVLIAALLATTNVRSAFAEDQYIGPEIVGNPSPLVSNNADSLPWGVIGFGSWTHVSTNLRVPVFALAEVGDRIFVGGMFAAAKHGSGGSEIAQPFLAAFDRNTGEFISDWRPVLDASVYALEATSDGKLIVGGDFTSVNGQPNTTALAALDPLTGAVVPTWQSHLERPWSSSQPVVRAISIDNGWVYAAGNFSHQTSFASRTRVYKAIRVRESDGILDTAWLPEVTGAGLWSMSVAPDASRTTLGGYHSAINGQPNTRWIGVVNGTSGATVPGLVYQPTHSSSAHVQGIYDTGDKLYYTGSQHYVFRHDTTTWAREGGTTYTQGGDGQAIEISDGIVYTACHCLVGTAWTDSYRWPTPSAGAQPHPVNGISAHNQSDFSYRDDFYPQIYYGDGDGPWDLLMDSGGCLWVGGDTFRLEPVQPYRWSRGFARLCRQDAEAPSTPLGLTATVSGPNQNDAVLSWLPSTDNRGVTGYEIYRDGNVVATVNGTTWTDFGIAGPSIYRVRALDARGNKSATSEPATATPISNDLVLVAAGSNWRYLDTGSNPGAAWNTPGFDDSGWPSGSGQLGFGDGDESTTVASGHVAYFFRHSFTVADPTAASLDLQLLVDDGAIVYLNGVELIRENMAPGPIGFPGWPTGWKGTAVENLYTAYNVPASALVAGGNVLAVSAHNASSGNGDLGFDLGLSKSADTPPTEPQLAVAAGSNWRYLDNGSNPGVLWATLGFDDAGWASGPAKLGYGDGDEATVLQQGSPRHITHYFRQGFTVVDPGEFTTIALDVRRDDGAVVYLNGTELIRDNMPAGPIGPTTLASDYAFGTNETQFHSFTVPAGALVAGPNVIAVEVHSADIGSQDLGFDMAATLLP